MVYKPTVVCDINFMLLSTYTIRSVEFLELWGVGNFSSTRVPNSNPKGVVEKNIFTFFPAFVSIKCRHTHSLMTVMANDSKALDLGQD